MKKPVYLFGPFVGELSWEYYRFAPYAINIKKEHPDIPLVVFTRPERFDLYGEYADILVPLRIPNDAVLEKDCFKIDSLMTKDYNRIARVFASKYKRRFQIIKHVYPDVSLWRYKLKWQFPRRLMDYDFKAREKNRHIAKRLIKRNNFIIDNNIISRFDIPEGINMSDLTQQIADKINNYDSTPLGTAIELLKICRFVVGNLDSDISRLAILLNKPLICVDNKMSEDDIHLLNPLKVPVIIEDDIEKGIEKYENII